MKIELRERNHIKEYFYYQRKYNRIVEAIIDIDSINDAGFARHNPKISEYCLKNSENLIQSLIFCVASQGIGWNVVAPLFKVMYQKLLKDGTLNVVDEDFYDKNEDWIDILGKMGSKKVIPINFLWKNRKDIFDNTKRILRKWHYEDTSDESKDAVIDLFNYYTTLPQLGLAKAGFAVQLITGALGCFDSVNQKIYGNVEIPQDIKDTLLNLDDLGNYKKNVFKSVSSKLSMKTKIKRLKAYADFLEVLAKTTVNSASERLWDIWVTIVSDRLKNTLYSGGKQKDNPEFQTILKRGNEILTTAKPYSRYPKNPHITKWEDENLSTITPDKLSAQHHPKYLTYGEY